MNESDKAEQFVTLLTENQSRLFGYIYSLLGDRNRTADVLQETNLVLWRKVEEFQIDKPFCPWAFSVARYQVLAHLRDRKRDRMLLNEELVDLVSPHVEKQATQVDAMREALQPCLQQLTEANRELIEHRYFQLRKLSDIANLVDRTVGAVKLALLRVRRQLADCVEKRMTAEG
ncbi:sigma-70 family RNA polymerase sigma factor [Calycomorphotria hydatis]|uniref:RNA polymerase sigma factor SigM n=1 Tax=Calycomorphotria hydatis TaxID=2528027 RepID=A0A517TE72_9PLAN|nr:sigma-70 family RNA polymerase sigma factor [Calycomorphotria hydatis]QDT66675.1 RNA polymerase sigma factor SigM [Calycomorphotria hydatis]